MGIISSHGGRVIDELRIDNVTDGTRDSVGICGSLLELQHVSKSK